VPGGVGVGGREVRIPGPHHQVDQGQLEDGHHLVFAVVQFVHGLLALSQILQLPQEVALLSAGSLAGVERGTEDVVGLPLALLILSQVSLRYPLPCLASFAQEVPT